MQILYTILKLAVITVLVVSLLEALVLSARNGLASYDWKAAGISVVDFLVREWFLNTPSAHRVHHAANLEYLDGNDGGVLIVFDRLFGTCSAERADTPCRYGLVQPMTSYNLLTIEFHQWQALWRDMRAAKSPADVCRYLRKPPGWRPDGLGQTTEDLRRQAAGPATAAAAPVVPATTTAAV